MKIMHASMQFWYFITKFWYFKHWNTQMDSESHCLGFSSKTLWLYFMRFPFYQTLYYRSLGILLPNFDTYIWYFIRLCITVLFVFYKEIKPKIKIIVFFRPWELSNLPRVYPTPCKPDIPITCDSAGAETSRSPPRWTSIPGVAYPLSLVTTGQYEHPHPPEVLNLWPPRR